jgi:hypothetical protein
MENRGLKDRENNAPPSSVLNLPSSLRLFSVQVINVVSLENKSRQVSAFPLKTAPTGL